MTGRGLPSLPSRVSIFLAFELGPGPVEMLLLRSLATNLLPTFASRPISRSDISRQRADASSALTAFSLSACVRLSPSCASARTAASSASSMVPRRTSAGWWENSAKLAFRLGTFPPQTLQIRHPVAARTGNSTPSRAPNPPRRRHPHLPQHQPLRSARPPRGVSAD
jgi:hypothetical protein